MTKKREYVEKMAQEALMVVEPIPVTATHCEENILHILEDDEEDPVESG